MADGLSMADWNAGTFAADQSWTSSPSNTWIDLGQDAVNMFYYFGPDYISFDPPEDFSVAIRNIGDGDFIAGTRHCKLRVTYTTSLGKGDGRKRQLRFREGFVSVTPTGRNRYEANTLDRRDLATRRSSLASTFPARARINLLAAVVA